MRIYIEPTTASRIKDAWNKLSPDQRSRILPLFHEAHQKTLLATKGVPPPVDSALGPPLNFAMSVINDNVDGVVDTLDFGIIVTVDGGGEIWGTGKYEGLDTGWLEALAEWLENLLKAKNPFNSSPVVTTIPDDVQIALAGDWGTGDWRTKTNPSPSRRICDQIKVLNPHFTIHLGDVYYAGTHEEEQHILAKTWPAGVLGSFALNSNHEMYSGGGPYFAAIGKAPFQMQGPCSYFALENAAWIIVGLDSAYFADEWSLYREGSLFRAGQGTVQLDFLKAQAAKRKKIILLTHHNGLLEDGSGKTPLWTQVMSAFPQGEGPAYWYWGHMHAAVSYDAQNAGTFPVQCRCSGHGALPCGPAGNLNQNPKIVWHECRNAGDPDIANRVFNGFAVISLTGQAMTEKFYDENGGVAWPVSCAAGSSPTVALLRSVKVKAVRHPTHMDAVPPESSLRLRIFDGSRQPVSPDVKILFTITDGNEHQLLRDEHSSDTTFRLPFYNNFGDDYTVLAFAKGYEQAGYKPIKCSPKLPEALDIMLLKKDGAFRFADAKWGTLLASQPKLCELLAQGAGSVDAAASRYSQLMETQAPVLACLLNITTAMKAITLRQGNPLQYFKELIWDKSMAQDRFYGWADPALYDEVRAAAAQGTFSREAGFGAFHSGATDSYKQIQFGEANVQLTFHANDTKVIDGLTCIKMEPDIDYYKEMAAHTLLEVISNGLSGNLTDPRQVYVLRWIAGRHAGVPEFDPPYFID
jgi:hypothetical protein